MSKHVDEASLDLSPGVETFCSFRTDPSGAQSFVPHDVYNTGSYDVRHDTGSQPYAYNPYQQGAHECPGYIDEFGQFIPLPYGYQPFQSRGHKNVYPGSRGGRRPRRGRASYGGYRSREYDPQLVNHRGYQYGYQNNRDYYHSNYQSTGYYDYDASESNNNACSPQGAKPKQFSYQRNRYRENRNQRATQMVEQQVKDSRDNDGPATPYSQVRTRNSRQHGEDPTEDKRIDGDVEGQTSDSEEKSYNEKTHGVCSSDSIRDAVNQNPSRNPANKRGNYGNTSRSNSGQGRKSSSRRSDKTSDMDKASPNNGNDGSQEQDALREKEFSGGKAVQEKGRRPTVRAFDSKGKGHDQSPAYSKPSHDKDKPGKSARGRWREKVDGAGRGKYTESRDVDQRPPKHMPSERKWRVDYENSPDDTVEDQNEATGAPEELKKDSSNVRPAGDFPHKPKSNYSKKKFSKKGGEDAENQRGALIEQLSNNTYECMVCCDVIRREAAVWSCANCHHVFHLRCAKKWARSPNAVVEGQAGWRCPACQNVCGQVPTQYRCYCGRVRDPEHSRYDTPHSCGEICRRKRGEHCIHLCNILCHPGPCPECQASVTRHCYCGKSEMTLKCSQSADVTCQEQCRKTLNCGRHECVRTCHKGACEPCAETVAQECYCGKKKREVVCGTSDSFTTSFCCEQPCNRKLSCDHHVCDGVCHPGSCDPCRLLPEAVRYCACLKTPLDEIATPREERKSCMDPIPTCDKLCEKELNCGTKDSPHKCDKQCHEAACGPCPLESQIRCRCGALENTVPCADLDKYTGANEFRCDKRCNKKKDCGRHRCQNTCCMELEHTCDLVCNKKLTCGIHRCEEPCHRGNCPRCWQVSFDELSCHCGAEVIMPPIPCGTRPPECGNPCTRIHSCGHEARHPCHSEDQCPPCPQLTEKWCMGGHERRRNIACHVTDVSCGMRCGKPLACGHKCQLTCHRGDCESSEKACTQPCSVIRAECGHPCAVQCHADGPCPPTQCRAQITVSCECGNRTEKGLCQLESRNSQEYQKMAASMLAMNRIDGDVIDISDLTKNKKKPRKLECTSDCAIKERNKRMAEALNISNPDVSNKPGASYTDYLKDYAKKNSTFSASVEKALSDLVLTAQKSAHKSRSHSFMAMRENQRKFIHELAEYYGCTTQSYDEEPQRNVVATAVKDKCYRPSVTLTAVSQRELHPKAPTPIPHRSSEQQIRSSVQASNQSTQVLGPWGVSTPRAASSSSKPPTSSMTTLSKKTSACSSNADSPLEASDSKYRASASSPWSLGTMSKSMEKTSVSAKEPVIDYFDMTD